jgi:hypothetical protein
MGELIKGKKMNHRKSVVIGLAAGFLALVPAVASAATATPSTPASSPTTAPPTTPTTPTRGPVGPTTLSLSTSRGVPGDKVAIAITCDEESHLSSPAMTIVKDIHRYHAYTGTVNKVLPGTYGMTLTCHHREGNFDTSAYTQFFVLSPPVVTPPVKTPPSKAPAAKQVAKVPTGAPATGGGGMAGDLG